VLSNLKNHEKWRADLDFLPKVSYSKGLGGFFQEISVLLTLFISEAV